METRKVQYVLSGTIWRKNLPKQTIRKLCGISFAPPPPVLAAPAARTDRSGRPRRHNRPPFSPTPPQNRPFCGQPPPEPPVLAATAARTALFWAQPPSEPPVLGASAAGAARFWPHPPPVLVAPNSELRTNDFHSCMSFSQARSAKSFQRKTEKPNSKLGLGREGRERTDWFCYGLPIPIQHH